MTPANNLLSVIFLKILRSAKEGRIQIASSASCGSSVLKNKIVVFIPPWKKIISRSFVMLDPLFTANLFYCFTHKSLVGKKLPVELSIYAIKTRIL